LNDDGSGTQIHVLVERTFHTSTSETDDDDDHDYYDDDDDDQDIEARR